MIIRFLSIAALVALTTFAQSQPPVDTSQAEALQRARKWAEARAEYEALLPQLTGEHLADAYNKMGYGYERDRNQLDKAIEMHRKAVAVPGATPSNLGHAWLRIGYCLKAQNNDEEAIEAFKRVQEIDGVPPSTAANALLFMAWTYNSMGNPEAATETMRRITRMQDIPSHTIGTAYASIGRIAEGRRDWQAALDAYRQILEIGATTKQISEARGRITEVELLLQGDLPFYILPYAINVTADGATIKWVAQGETEPGVVHAGGRTFPSTISPLPKTECTLHSAALEGFSPGQRIDYVVHSGSQTRSGTFKTAPSPGTPVVIAATGDSQGPPSLHKGVADALAAYQPDLMLHVGDLTDKGNEWGRWREELFQPGQAYFTTSVFAPTYGNHDGGPYYPRLFDTSGGKFYAFEYGDVFIVSLESYGGYASHRLSPKQLEWLDEQLASTTARWKLVNLHVPMVTTDASASWFGTTDFHPMLEKHRVDVVVCGHHPIYRRYLPIGQPGQHPILHITTGGAGFVGSPIPSPILSQGGDTQHFTILTFTADTLEMIAGDGNGTVIDTFSVTKDAAGNFPADYIASSVPINLAKQIRHIYQELLTPNGWDLLLTLDQKPLPGAPSTFILDLDRLPRGTLDTSTLPPDTRLLIEAAPGSEWGIPAQTLDIISQRQLPITLTPPGNASFSGGTISPNLELSITLRIGDRSYLPTIARVRLPADAQKILADSQQQAGSLPVAWDFKLDPDDIGVSEKWYNQSAEGWQKMLITQVWEQQMPDPYDGVAWYQTTFTKPELKDQHRLWLKLGAVDESCRVYLNGTLIGDQVYDSQIDDTSWEKPRRFDLTPALQAGDNLLTIRVVDTFGHGGIYRGAALEQFPVTRIPNPLPALDWQGDAADLTLALDNGKYVDEKALAITHTGTAPVTIHKSLPAIPAGAYTATMRWRGTPLQKGQALTITINQADQAIASWTLDRPLRQWTDQLVPMTTDQGPLSLSVTVHAPGTYALDALTITP